MSWEDIVKEETSSLTVKRKLKRLLKILNSDIDDSAKVNQAKGYLNSYMKELWGDFVRFPPPAQFFDYLANNNLYPIIENIYKVKSKKSQGKAPIEKEIFPKFENVDSAEEFSEIFERDFNDQRRRILASVGPKGRDKQFESSAELYSTMWDRLSKFLREKGVVRSRPKSEREIIESFIENPKDYKKFYDYIKGKTSSDKTSAIKNLKADTLGEDRLGILLEIMNKNYTGGQKPSVEEFYTDDFPYFDYVALEITMTRITDSRKAPEGWEIQRNLAGDNTDFVKFVKILGKNDSEIKDKVARRKMIEELRDSIVELEEKKRKTGKDTEVFTSVPKDKQIQYETTINYPLMYEILVQSDKNLTKKTLNLADALEIKLELKEQSEDERISAYFDSINDRQGVVNKNLLLDIRREPTVKLFFGVNSNSRTFPPHPSIEKILTKGLSVAIDDAVADSLISEKDYLLSVKRAGTNIDDANEKQRIKEERREKLENIKFYDKKTLILLFAGVRSGRVDDEFEEYVKYLKDNDIDTDTDITSSDFNDIGEKLVLNATKTKLATSNTTLQNKLDKDLQLMFEDYRVNEEKDLEDDNILIYNPSTKTVSIKGNEEGMTDEELRLDEQEGDRDTTFAKAEERALYSLVKTVELLALNEDDIKYKGELSQGDIFSYGFVLAQNLLNKDYDQDADKLEELRKEDASTNNQELVAKIKELAAKVNKDLEQLKGEFVAELDRKLKDIVESRGKYKSLYYTDAGQKLISIMVRNNLLNRGKK